MQPNLTNLNLLSEENYLKQDPVSGNATITLGIASPDVTVLPINYGISNNVRFYQVLSELDQTSTIWIPDIINANTNSSAFFTPIYPLVDHWIDTGTLTIRVDNSTSANTGSIIVYWQIYLDYGGTA